jgi:hypothetical protein
MAIPIPTRPNVRHCTHIKVTGQRCGSPTLRGEFFCYFHTRVIKGVQMRVDMRLDSMALLEDHESIQFSIMNVVDGLVKGTLDPRRAKLIIQALRIAARNAKYARFDDCYYEEDEQKMVRQVPNYARQYLIEHPEFGPPLDTKNECGAGAPAREPATKVSSQQETIASTVGAQQNVSPESAIAKQEFISEQDPAAERRKNAAHSASCGSRTESDPAPEERKSPRDKSSDREELEERELIQQAEAAIEGATRGNWRDLRTVFEFAGISPQTKEAPS